MAILSKAHMLGIPDLKTSSCTLLRACGQVEEPSRETRALLKGIGKKPAFVRLKVVYLVVLASPGGHLHIDILPREQLKGFEPFPSFTPAGKVNQFLQNLYGRQVTVTVEAVFSIPAIRLPAVIRNQMVKMQSGVVSVEQVAGKLKVSGAPFQEISWWRTDDEEARVRLEGSNALTLGNEYLLNAYAPLESGFRALTADGGANVSIG